MDDDEPKTERIMTPMSVGMVERLDEWRYANRIPSRAEAIRQLLEWALTHTGTHPKAPARRKKP